MNWLTADKADTLCTAIAVGFLKSQDKSGSRTFFGYEEDASQKEKADHAILQEALKDMNILTPINQLVDKSKSPMILAKRPETFDPAVLDGAVEPFRQFVKAAENEINSGKWGEPPRGAYIGGMLDLAKIELVGPSDVALWGAPPQYRAVTLLQAEAIRQSFNNAKNATNNLWDFIVSKTAESISWNRVYVTPSGSEKVIASYDPASRGLFQSIHGMVRAILTFGATLGDAGICFELALGNQTNKVASCLPCSIFMSACGLPATNTHLGRGDNWNFPATFWKRKSWEEAVQQHYREGLAALRPKAPALVAQITQDLGAGDARVPGAFLEALTYEGSFLGKMLRTRNAFGQ